MALDQAESAVHGQHLAGDIAGLARKEEHSDRADLPGGALAAHWDRGAGPRRAAPRGQPPERE